MAQFKYVGRDRLGKTRKGKIASAARKDAVVELRGKGIAVSEIVELEEGLFNKEISIGSPVKNQDFVIYLRQFSTLIAAGVSVAEATKILAQQTQSKALRKALLNVEEELRSGKPLSEAAASHAKIFPPMFINLVQAGEASGNLDETLERLAVYFEKLHYSMQKVKSALIYPIAIAIVAVAVVIYLLTNVVPTFASMFAQFNAELPAITKFVLAISDWLQSFWWLLLLLLLGVVIGVALILQNPSSKYYLDYALLKLPIFGKLVQKSAIARMTRTLNSLFKSSVPILDALTIVEKVVMNEVMVGVLKESRASLEGGNSLSEPMRRHWIFPPLVTQMIAIGEQSGSLDFMLEKISDFYDKEVEATADALKGLIEPLMIIFLAAMVGGIVLSIIVPMFDIFNHVK
ncbi:MULTISPECIES: type II secretion system F family protein [unclassified Paenibacillus]|uniref:type II secretion system F family protein n=1 Tax=unclassified Paenibacillus TaxID=185978 RepID=UPI001C0F8F06|nr:MULTISPECIES: type II secretion system F family protein [unclassified Paenibacillus]MBU5444989.1 type II secretion system F family protein [Paenibacillus sp. MSJ-34]CAH0121299.1 Type II secretion system protein F [Paenibacillus sp. CECT 9249]